MRNNFIKIPVLLFFLFCSFQTADHACAENYEIAPVKIQTAIFLKILGFHKGVSTTGNITIHVIEAPEFAVEIKKRIGRRVGNSTLVSVTEGTLMPEQNPTIIYLGTSKKLEEVTAYTQKNQILSITGMPQLVAKGITLGIGVANDKPQILLNKNSSQSEGANWNPAIYTIVTVFE